MTVAIEPNTTVVDAVRTVEPRIDTVPEKWRDIIASMVLADIPFDVAMAKFSSVLTDAEKAATEQKITQQKVRETTTATFTAAVAEFIKAEALKIAEKERPHVWRILADYDTAQKNADGTPTMDSENNPVRALTVEVSATWTRKNLSDATDSAATGTRGRLGGYLKIEGRNESFGSLKEAAAAIGVADAPNARANITGAGYTIGTVKQTDSDGKSFYQITKTVAPVTNGATV